LIAQWVAMLALAASDRPVEKTKVPQAVQAASAEEGASLIDIRRVYVDRLTGGESAAQIRDLLIGALEKTKLFVITENEERADAVLRGAAEDLLFTDKFSSSDGISAHANGGAGSSGSTSSKTRGGRYSGISISDNESTHTEERKHEAMATVRLVNKGGDVIWSTTQESLGAKFRGASADVVDKVAKQLAADLDRARKTPRLP
jgi:hypothetical protein